MDAQALGRYLRETREAREQTLDEVERALHIRRRILEQFEMGDFNVSGASSVQIRGFIRNYARFLSLDDDRVVLLYESALQEGERRGKRRKKQDRSNGKTTDTHPEVVVATRAITDTPPSLPKVTLTEPRRRNNLLNTIVMALVGVAAIAIIAFVLFQLLQPTATLTDDDSSDILADLPPSATFTRIPTLTVSALTPSIEPRPGQVYSGSGVLVSVEMVQRTWIRLVTDGSERYVGIAPPGMILEYLARESITVTASNAQALNVLYNGQQQGVLGGRGQRVDITFTETDMQIVTGPGFEATPIFTSTPQPTSDVNLGATIAALTPTITAGPSPTPTLTFTPSNTPTITFTPSITPTASDTPTATNTPTETFTPGPTATETDTPTITPTPQPTAILPPREPALSPTPTKDGG